MLKIVSVSLVSVLLLSACEPVRETRYDAYGLEPRIVPDPPSQRAEAFAVQFLNGLQPRSIAESREYCGYFLVNADGSFEATKPIPGTEATCEYPAPYDVRIFASYHTHGSFSPDYDNEVPSPADLISDFEFALDGYVSTPGGRVWHVDYETRSAWQICGLGCVYTDPNWQPVDETRVRPRYTIAGVRARVNY